MADWVVGAELLVVLEVDCRRAVRLISPGSCSFSFGHVSIDVDTCFHIVVRCLSKIRSDGHQGCDVIWRREMDEERLHSSLDLRPQSSR